VSSAAEPVPLVDQISLGVLTTSVSRDAVQTSIAAHGKQAKRSGGALPPHVVMYFVIAMALHADLDYEGVMRKMTEPLRFWRSWDPKWVFPTSGAITQARARLGFEPVKECFERVAVPVAGSLTPDAFCAGHRMVSLDGMVFDLPDTDLNRKEFGKPSGGAFPQARVVTLTESASHVSLGGHIGGVRGKGSGERTAAAELVKLLERDMILLCDQGFYSFDLWCRATSTGAEMLWRIGDIMDLPIVAGYRDGSYLTVLFAPGVSQPDRARLLVRARAGDDLSDVPDRARLARAVEYEVTDRGSGDLICLLTSILDPFQAPALMLAEAYHQRWQHEAANKEIKTQMRGPGKILRSKSPDMVRQEIYGYLLAHYAICAFLCYAAEETGIDPDRIKFTNSFRIIADKIADPEAFSP
jgi:hypothetical protein